MSESGSFSYHNYFCYRSIYLEVYAYNPEEKM